MIKKWTPEEIEFLIENYPKLSLREIGRKIGKSKGTVKSRILSLGMKIKERHYNLWTDAEILKLKNLYENSYKADILKIFPNRKVEDIESKANELGLYKNRNLFILGKVNNLLNGSHISFYWIGFLLADGHFSKDNRLQVALAEKDRDHLEKLARFLEYRGETKRSHGNYCFSIMDNVEVEKIKQKYDIKNNKTYEPPSLDVFKELSDDFLLSLLIGFIDGDGSVGDRKNIKSKYITIKCHSSWLEILNLFTERLSALVGIKIPIGKLNTKGYARIFITNNIYIKYLKNKAIKFNLPILARKWDKIDLDFVSREENVPILRQKIRNMISLGYKNKRISEELKISPSTVTKYSKEAE